MCLPTISDCKQIYDMLHVSKSTIVLVRNAKKSQSARSIENVVTYNSW